MAAALVLVALMAACAMQLACLDEPQDHPFGAAAATAATAGTATAPSAAVSSLIPAEVLIPSRLGKIRARFAGAPGKPLILVVGEDHVALAVQRAEADLLGYLVQSYHIKTLCFEGYHGAVTPRDPGLPLLARRAAAAAEMENHQIGAVEYTALLHPGLRVVGVEDMAAYNRHRKALADAPLTPAAQELDGKLEALLGSLRVAHDDATRIKDAFVKGKENCNPDLGFQAIYSAIGRDSANGKRLAELLERRQALASNAAALVAKQADDPLMQQRNQQLAAQAFVEAGSAGPVILVVGSLHLPGLERILRAGSMPYVSMLPAGMGDDLLSANGVQDGCWYSKLAGGRQSGLEALGQHLRYETPLARPAFIGENVIVSALFAVDLGVREGDDDTAARKMLASASLPEGFRLIGIWRFGDVAVMQFAADGQTLNAWFWPESKTFDPDPGAVRLAAGGAAGRRFEIFNQGGGPPKQPPPTGPSQAGPFDGGPFNRKFVTAVVEHDRRDRTAATLSFGVVDGQVVRMLGGVITPLGVAIAEVEAEKRRLREASTGPDRLFAVQRLAELLLVDIDRGLAPGVTRLAQLSQDDFLGDLRLPSLAKLAGLAGSERFASIADVAFHPWRDTGKDLGTLDRRPAPLRLASTVFLIADRLARSAQGLAMAGVIRNLGGRVNERPVKGDALVVLGSARAGWKLTLADGTSLSRAALDRLAASSPAVVVWNLELGTGAAAAAVRSHRAEDGAVLDLARRIAQAIHQHDGQDSLDKVLHDATENDLPGARDELRQTERLDEVAGPALALLDVNLTAPRV